VQSFAERHGLRACMVAPTKIIAGLGMCLGIDCLEAPGGQGLAACPSPIQTVALLPMQENCQLGGQTNAPL
jgi:hypothetical protein